MSQVIKVLMMPDYREGNPFQHLLEQSLTGEGVEVLFAKGYKRLLPVYRQVRMHQGIDILHLHWLTPYLKGKNHFVLALYAVKLICDITLVRLRGTKIVWTIHNHVSHDTQFPGIEIFTYRMISRLAHAAILHGNSLRDIILKDYKIDAKKLSIIYLGNYRDIYPSPIEKSEARKKLAITDDVRNIFLLQGLLKPYKGIEELIRVWNQTEAFGHNVLIIAGKASDIGYENTLKSLSANSKTISLIFRYVTDDEITILYSACDVVVLPFRKIMVSSSLMVAISFGKPVIAPRIGGCEELLGNADDLLYDPNDLNGLSNSIGKSGNMDLSELNVKTKARADLYNWDDIGRKTAELYRRAIQETNFYTKF